MTLQIAFRHGFPGIAFDIAIDTPTPGVTCLFGPSGAGKSTIAAVAAGLLQPADARVVVDGAVLSDTATRRFVAPEQRRIGLVFQDTRLFPHLSVDANLRYGLRRAAAGTIAFDDVVVLLGLADLLGRKPLHLSGGERQRVAIGRALLSQPRLLVMDEPLASLEDARRADILPYLQRLRDTLALPILYVTHVMDEVIRLADTLVLVDHGRSIATGPVAAMLARTDLSPASRDDAAGVLECRVLAHLPDRALTRLALAGAPGVSLLVPLQSYAAGSSVRARIPAAEVIIATEAPRAISVQNLLPARIETVQRDGSRALVELRLGSAPLLARITADAASRLALQPGMDILALIKSVAVMVSG